MSGLRSRTVSSSSNSGFPSQNHSYHPVHQLHLPNHHPSHPNHHPRVQQQNYEESTEAFQRTLQKTSRELFYLQLHNTNPGGSSIETRRINDSSISPSHVTVSVPVPISNGSRSPVTRQVSVISERERDIGDSFHPQEMAFDANSTFVRNIRVNDTLRSSRKLEPVLNDRMKDLTNFSLRYRDREKVIKQKTYTCYTKRLLFSSVGILFSALFFIVILVVLLNRPDPFGSKYENKFARDSYPEVQPTLSLCLSVPFSQRRLREFGVPPRLAFYLLYALSPLYSDEDLLSQKDVLADLQAQYLSLASKISRPSSSAKSSKSSSIDFDNLPIRKILRKLAPKCSHVITGCQIDGGGLIPGEKCCRQLFNKIELTVQGLCFVAPNFGRLASEIKFPIKTSQTSHSSLKLLLDTSSTALFLNPVSNSKSENFDKKLSAVKLIVTESREDLAYIGTGSSIDISAGEENQVIIEKQAVDNYYPGSSILGGCSRLKKISQSEAKCRSKAIQMISEKSLNCSLLTLEPMNPSLQLCDPMEGLALTYVLKEQGALVSENREMLESFEENIASECPSECYYQNFDISHLTRVLPKSPISSVIDILYKRDSDYIKVTVYRSGIITWLEKLGSFCGIVSFCALIFLAFRRVYVRNSKSGRNSFQSRYL